MRDIFAQLLFLLTLIDPPMLQTTMRVAPENLMRKGGFWVREKEFENFCEGDAAFEYAYIRASRMNFIFLITIVLLALVVWRLNGRKEIVVGLNDLGVPYHLKRVNNTLPGADQAELFLREFVALTESYNAETWRGNLNLAADMMTKEYAAVYKGEMEKRGYEGYLAQNDVTQTAVIRDLKFVGSTQKKGDLYYRVQALVERTRVAGGIPSSETLEFIIDMKRIPLNPSVRYGLYGLEIAGCQKKPVPR